MALLEQFPSDTVAVKRSRLEQLPPDRVAVETQRLIQLPSESPSDSGVILGLSFFRRPGDCVSFKCARLSFAYRLPLSSAALFDYGVPSPSSLGWYAALLLSARYFLSPIESLSSPPFFSATQSPLPPPLADTRHFFKLCDLSFAYRAPSLLPRRSYRYRVPLPSLLAEAQRFFQVCDLSYAYIVHCSPRRSPQDTQIREMNMKLKKEEEIKESRNGRFRKSC